MLNTKAKRSFYLLLSAFILMYFAFYDGFPILTNDSGTYIDSGFSLKPPLDRPIFYGLFIRITSLGISVWMTIFFQCLILAYTIIQFLKKVIPGIPNAHILAFIIFLSFFTICGWFAGQLMPDFFVPLMIIAAGNYLVFENSRKEQTTLLSIIFLSVLTHNSNYVIITIYCILFLLLSLVIKTFRIYNRKSLVLCFIGVAAWLSLCFSNMLGGNGFTTSKSTHVFVMGKLIESGVLKVYLEKACPIRDYKICKYKDSLPDVAWTFHWDASSPVQKEGGWDANKKEYNTIITDILSRPKYWPFLAYKSAEATARQLALTNIDGNYILPWALFDEGTAPYEAVEKYFPHELNELKNSRMNTKTLSIIFYDNLFLFIAIISTIILLFMLPLLPKKNKTNLLSILTIFICLILLNAFATASLSSVNARFNARVFWLIPFFNSVVIYKTIYLNRRNGKIL